MRGRGRERAAAGPMAISQEFARRFFGTDTLAGKPSTTSVESMRRLQCLGTRRVGVGGCGKPGARPLDTV